MTSMPAQDRLVRVQAVIAQLFDADVGVGVTDPRQQQPVLMAGEGDHLADAIPKRCADFAAGRAAARKAMQNIGIAPRPVFAHKDRAPIWPAGITGSITHKDTLCAAVVTAQDKTLGIDVEEDTPLNPDLMPTVCSEREIARIAGPHENLLAKLIFSAKEAVYKAQYPVTRQLFGFDHMEVMIDQPGDSFTATFTKPVGMFYAGATLPGRFAQVEGHLVTAVTLRQAAHKGN